MKDVILLVMRFILLVDAPGDPPSVYRYNAFTKDGFHFQTFQTVEFPLPSTRYSENIHLPTVYVLDNYIWLLRSYNYVCNDNIAHNLSIGAPIRNTVRAQ